MSISFIWSNSILSSDKSNARSDHLKDWLKGFFQYDQSNVNVNENDEKETKTEISGLIRKMAHFIEFMVLGMTLMLLKILNKKIQLFQILFICLSIAVIDEFIQSFSDRTDSVKDVLIDFSGAAVGIVIMFVIYQTVKYVKKVRKLNTERKSVNE